MVLGSPFSFEFENQALPERNVSITLIFDFCA